LIVFDTDVIASVLHRMPPTDLIRRLATLDPADQATTAISVGELVVSARKSRHPERLLTALDQLLWPNLAIIPFDRKAAQEYGRLRVELEAKGQIVSEPELRIGAICMSRGATLVTGSDERFSILSGLNVVNWLTPHQGGGEGREQ
jgi:tRNA(fMet)-specific endonuclease VapC